LHDARPVSPLPFGEKHFFFLDHHLLFLLSPRQFAWRKGGYYRSAFSSPPFGVAQKPVPSLLFFSWKDQDVMADDDDSRGSPFFFTMKCCVSFFFLFNLVQREITRISLSRCLIPFFFSFRTIGLVKEIRKNLHLPPGFPHGTFAVSTSSPSFFLFFFLPIAIPNINRMAIHRFFFFSSNRFGTAEPGSLSSSFPPFSFPHSDGRKRERLGFLPFFSLLKNGAIPFPFFFFFLSPFHPTVVIGKKSGTWGHLPFLLKSSRSLRPLLPSSLFPFFFASMAA